MLSAADFALRRGRKIRVSGFGLRTSCRGEVWYPRPMLARVPRLLLLGAFAISLTGCVASYQDALGYRARRAAERGDVDAFEGLMQEASVKKPRSPLLKPQRTVLTHFLELAGHARFFETIEAWRKQGWVSDNLTCAIHRARYRHSKAEDPKEADRAAQVCVQRARAAAYSGARSWEIEACLDEAPFLTETSTQALVPYLEVVADAGEPRALRRALLEGMTKLFLQDVHIRTTNAPELPAEGHRAQAEAQYGAAVARFQSLVEAARGGADPVLIAAGSAVGALELERVALTQRRSFLWSYALSAGDPERTDLAFAWVRSMKAKEKLFRHASLGLWNRAAEPAGDAFWYACLSRPEVKPTFASARVQVTPLRASTRDDAKAQQSCRSLAADRQLMGPFPLKATLRGSVTASVSAAHNVERVRVRMHGTKVLGAADDG